MHSEAQSAIARLNGLLDDLDQMHSGSVGNLENRLSVVRSTLEKSHYRGGGQAVASQAFPEQEALQESISQYEQRVSELEAQVADAADKDVRIAELEGLTEELAKRDALIAEHKATVKKLRKREADHTGLDAKLTEYNEQVSALENTVQEREAKAKGLEGQVQERDAQIESLRGQIQESDQQGNAAEGATREVEKKLAVAREEIDTLVAEAEKKDGNLQSEQETAVLLKDEVRQRDLSIGKLEKDIQKGKDDLVALREQLDKSQTDNAVGDLQSDLDEKTKKLKSIEGALRVTEEGRAKLEVEVKMLLGEIDGMRSEHAELEALQGKMVRLEAELQGEREAILRLKAQQNAAPVVAEEQPALVSEVAPAESGAGAGAGEAKKRVIAAAKKIKGRRGGHKQMGAILVEAGVLTEKQLEEVIGFQAADTKKKLGDVVVERGYATEEVIAAALAAQMGVRFIDNLEKELQPGVINLVPIHLIKNHRCVPLVLDGGDLLVAMANPLDLIGIENIELATNLHVDVAAAAPGEIDDAIVKYFTKGNM